LSLVEEVRLLLLERKCESEGREKEEIREEH